MSKTDNERISLIMELSNICNRQYEGILEAVGI